MDVNKKIEVKIESKKAWTKPELVAYGSVEDITNSQDKKYGSADGFTFMGVSIKNAS